MSYSLWDYTDDIDGVAKRRLKSAIAQDDEITCEELDEICHEKPGTVKSWLEEDHTLTYEEAYKICHIMCLSLHYPSDEREELYSYEERVMNQLTEYIMRKFGVDLYELPPKEEWSIDRVNHVHSLKLTWDERELLE